MSATQRLLRFGIFELNLDTEELRKDGLPMKLGPQPFRVLVMLASRSGQLVSRDEIRQAIWGEETYVDFEHGLNQCIKQIRTVLNDNTTRPLYIETLPRKGYRFLAPVTSKTIAVTPKVTAATSGVQPLIVMPGGTSKEPHLSQDWPVAHVAATAPQLAPAKAQPEDVARPDSSPSENPVPALLRPKWYQRRAVQASLGLLLAVACMASWFYWRSQRIHALNETDTVVLADFDNKTGDPVFDDTLRTAVTMAVDQSPFVNLLSEPKLKETLALMRRPGDSRLSSDVAREVAERAGSKAYISGSISNLGKEYVFEIKAVNCRTGDILAQQQVTAASKEQVLIAVGKATTQLRSQLGEKLTTVQKFDVPLVKATTSSLEALQAYSRGVKARAQKGSAALPYLERAVQLDPNFATAYADIGGIYEQLGELGKASEYISKAFELREHASDREKLFITRSYYATVTGELDKAERTDLEMIENYPRIASEYKNLGLIYGLKGQYGRAVEVLRQAQSLGSSSVGLYIDMANFLLAAQHPDESRQTVQEAHARNRDSYLLHLTSYGLAFLAADSAGMSEQQQWFGNAPGLEHWGLSLASDTAAYSGHLAEAAELSGRAAASAVQAGSPENGAIWWQNAALRYAAFGKVNEAQKAVAAGLKLEPASKSVQVEAALAYAMTEDTGRAESLAKELDAQYPVDTQVQSLWLPAIRAQLALNRQSSKEAVERLQLALPPIEYGQIRSGAYMSCLYPTYIRGEALLAEGQGAAAAVEFKKILDHSGVIWNCWTGALAQLGMARAQVMQAKTEQGANAEAANARALADYKNFLALWKDADADIPIYQQAKAEYAKLQ